jgi:hypothetical protein
MLVRINLFPYHQFIILNIYCSAWKLGLDVEWNFKIKLIHFSKSQIAPIIMADVLLISNKSS